MMSTWLAFVLMGVAFVVTTLIYPYVLAFARRYGIVDNPSARKLQRVPVPVMGGTAVFVGFLVTVIVGLLFVPNVRVIRLTILLFVMYAVGVWDDIKDVSASVRFLVELVVVWLMILLLDVEINDFHGFLGIDDVPDAISVPLSLIAGVGVMNAINLIDGVDGYCSTYGMMACAIFAAVFYLSGAMAMFAVALICIGALLPFFFHNVFGKTSKMFLGDGGSLMLGTMLAFFAFNTLTANSLCDIAYRDSGLSLVALCLAVLAVPVFDTIKVMVFRIIKGQSPFHPDKTHLHHLFIEMNFSHLITSAIIVLGNIGIVGVLMLSWILGANATVQVIVVVLAALAFTWGFYFFMEDQRRKNDGDGTALWKRWCRHGGATKITTTPFWLFIRKVVDSRILGYGFLPKLEDTATSPMAGRPRIDPRVGTAPPVVGSADSISSVRKEK